MSMVPMFNNRIPARQLDQVPAKQIFNERAGLAQSIAASQERLKVRRDLRLHEAELAKCTLKFLVKFDALLKELCAHGEQP